MVTTGKTIELLSVGSCGYWVLGAGHPSPSPSSSPMALSLPLNKLVPRYEPSWNNWLRQDISHFSASSAFKPPEDWREKCWGYWNGFLCGGSICVGTERGKSESHDLNTYYICYLGFPGGASGKETDCQWRGQERRVWSLGQEDPLKGGVATHASILAWRIPWTG